MRAVIFDCFGVLASDGLDPFFAKYFGHNSKLLDAATNLGRQADSGSLAYDDFIGRLAILAGTDHEMVRSQIEDNVPDLQLFSYIEKKLSPRFKIGLLSNAADNWLDELFTPSQVALFDEVALSYAIGFIKPQMGSYMAIAKKLSLDPSECIFVDDKERYCDGARQAGMQAVVYRNVRDLELSIDRLSK
ncbi:MAG TPA: HAD-IA family hydrolase [Candidatus Saccharimonadia bacterium]|nr:HAD-IA family hydrolase [Candidatus Saccharimonadia bacterium]